MSQSAWENLTRAEHDFMICAIESWSCLATAYEGEDEVEDLPAVVQSLVDRGWVNLHRIEPWTSPEGLAGAQYSDPIGLDEIPAILSDPKTWEYDTDWYGMITLSPTKEGRLICMRSPDED